MSRRRWPAGILAVALGVLLAASTAGGAGAPFRISNLVVTNSDSVLLVNLVLLGAMPDGIVEGLGTGIPAAVRFQLELWQYSSWWVDRRVVAKLVERQVVYDLIEDCVAPIVQGLRTHGMWIRAFAADSRTAGGYGAVHPP